MYTYKRIQAKKKARKKKAKEVLLSSLSNCKMQNLEEHKVKSTGQKKRKELLMIRGET